MKPLPLLLCALAALGNTVADEPAKQPGEPKDAFHYNRQLGRGINFGNALEAPRESEWGVTLREDYFERAQRAGFRSVRIPIRWSAHAGGAPSFEIDVAFFKRVDWAIEQALKRDLVVIINVHHFDEIHRDPDRHEAKLQALWRQIAERYGKQPEGLYFELLNEPHDNLTDKRWGKMIPKLLEAVRAALRQQFKKAAAWGKKNNRPLFLSEFGAYSAADMESRARWTRAVARETESQGMSWAYWEFGAGFGAYDRDAKAWRQPLLNALMKQGAARSGGQAR